MSSVISCPLSIVTSAPPPASSVVFGFFVLSGVNSSSEISTVPVGINDSAGHLKLRRLIRIVFCVDNLIGGLNRGVRPLSILIGYHLSGRQGLLLLWTRSGLHRCISRCHIHFTGSEPHSSFFFRTFVFPQSVFFVRFCQLQLFHISGSFRFQPDMLG